MTSSRTLVSTMPPIVIEPAVRGLPTCAVITSTGSVSITGPRRPDSDVAIARRRRCGSVLDRGTSAAELGDVAAHLHDLETERGAILEDALAVGRARHLADEQHHREAIAPRRGEAGHRVERARAGGHGDDAELARGVRVAGRREHRAALVARG